MLRFLEFVDRGSAGTVREYGLGFFIYGADHEIYGPGEIDADYETLSLSARNGDRGAARARGGDNLRANHDIGRGREFYLLVLFLFVLYCIRPVLLIQARTPRAGAS